MSDGASPDFSLQIPLDHPALAGHFPGQPIVPGVLLLDSLDLQLRQSQAGQWMLIQAKFLQPVLPGQPLDGYRQLQTDGLRIKLTLKYQSQAVVVAEFRRLPVSGVLP